MGDANHQICGLAPSACISIKTGINSPADQVISGTCCHLDLIPHIAFWISHDFVVLISKVINGYIVQEYKQKLEMAQIETETMTQLHAETAKKLQEEHREPTKWGSTHAFTMLRLNDPRAKMPYYVIRCRRETMNGNIKKIRTKLPYSILIYQNRYVPNAINVLSKLKSTGVIKTHLCYCKPNVDEAELIDILRSLYSVPVKPDF